MTGPEFMLELGISFYDIAYYNNTWWYACGDDSESVRIYDTNGTQVGSISSSIVPTAHGMTFDEDGFLWVSNMNTDEIYKVDVDATALERTTWAGIKTSIR